MEILEKLFGSAARVKMLRLFLFHSDELFTNEEIRRRTKVPVATCRKELRLLEKTGFLNQQGIATTAVSTGKKKKKGKAGKKKVTGFVLAPDFPFIDQFRSILITDQTFEKETMAKKLGTAGPLKLVIISGVFLGRGESRLDLLVVGNKLKKNVLENTIRTIEAEIGKELVYAVLDAQEYAYRLEVHDRLVRDVLDYPHEILVDRI